MYKEVKKCRICGNGNLISIFNLGNQYLTGVFPKSKEDKISCGPLELLKCNENEKNSFCGLVQLRQSYNLNEMYGMNYGYRSGLNLTMVEHLRKKVEKILESVDIADSDIVIDIGSNDSTLLQSYPSGRFSLVGIDPTGKKFKEYYPKHIQLIPEFFSAAVFRKHFGNKKAKIITSIAMFYDLESPIDFMKQICEILDNNGVWAFEQSYMPFMLDMNAYDTICQEHLEYYGLKQIKWMTDKVGLKIIDVEFNNVNGGSFSVTVAKVKSLYKEKSSIVNEILTKETQKGLNTPVPYEKFRQRIYKHRDELRESIQKVKHKNQKILGYGASTKGNVILQFCNLTKEDIPFIAEVNRDKFGCYTPGTLIPIISEEEARRMKPDYFMVLPWHFKANIIAREKEYLKAGGKLLLPLPKIEVI